jgi:hypothetical protein
LPGLPSIWRTEMALGMVSVVVRVERATREGRRFEFAFSV